MQDHAATVGKVTAGGVGATGTIWTVIASMPLDHAIQVATLISASFAGLYYLVAIIIAIKNCLNGNKS